MKKLDKKVIIKFRMPHLFRDELLTIEDIFKKQLSPRDFKITLDNCEYESVSEIPEGSNSVNNLSVTSYDPTISIDLRSYSADIYASDNDNLIVRGAVAKIQDVLKKNERKFRWIVHTYMSWLVIPFFLIFIISLSKKIPLQTLAFIAGLGIVLYLIFVVSSYFCVTRSFSKIEFSYKRNKPSFWERKKDEIVIALIGAFIGSSLTLLVEYILRKFILYGTA